MEIIDVVDEVDLVHAIAIQIEGEHWTEPHARNDSGAQITAPQHIAVRREERHLQRVRWKEEHLDVGIDVKVCTVDGEHRSWRSGAKAYGNGA